MQVAGTEDLASSAAGKLEARLAAAALRVVVRVSESRCAKDLAIALSPTRLAILRCVEGESPSDHTALATMISGGDFIWGAVVYEQGESPHSLGLIESFHISQLDQLVARLVELREACGEAG